MIIVTWHGEHGTLFYIVDETKPEELQPAIIATFNTRESAERYITND